MHIARWIHLPGVVVWIGGMFLAPIAHVRRWMGVNPVLGLVTITIAVLGPWPVFAP